MRCARLEREEAPRAARALNPLDVAQFLSGARPAGLEIHCTCHCTRGGRSRKCPELLHGDVAEWSKAAVLKSDRALAEKPRNRAGLPASAVS